MSLIPPLLGRFNITFNITITNGSAIQHHTLLLQAYLATHSTWNLRISFTEDLFKRKQVLVKGLVQTQLFIGGGTPLLN